MSDLAQRILTALVLAPLAVGAAYLGGWAFALFIALVAAAAQWEVYGLFEAGGARPSRWTGVAAGLPLVLWPVAPAVWPLAVVGLLALLVAELYRRLEAPLANVSAGAFGALYPMGLAGLVVYLRTGSEPALGEGYAFGLTATAIAAVWAADTFAYFAGRAFGRRPLFPRVSPKKTVEGLAGGIAGAVAFVLIVKALALPFLPWLDAAAVGLIAGLLSPLGDLAESLLKRSVRVKDSGTLLPGHGGVLDRIDAVLVAVPLIAIYLDVVAELF